MVKLLQSMLAVGLWLSATVVLSQEAGNALLVKEGGRVLRGRITEVGTDYQVVLESGSSVRLPKSTVEFVGQDIGEVYRHRTKAIRRWNSGDHMKLARWCILNDLSLEAIYHFEQVSQRHPDHPYVRKLGLELKQHLLTEPEFRSHLGLAPLDTSDSNSAVAQVENASNSVVPASALDSAGAQGEQLLTHPEVANFFAQRVQPILLNRCSQSGCHGGIGNTDLRIRQPYKAEHARITAENLQSVLGHARDDEQRFLKYAMTAHSTLRKPAIAVTETQLINILSGWLEFAKNPVMSAVATSESMQQGAVVTAEATQTIQQLEPLSRELVPVSPGDSGLRPVPQSRAELGFPAGDQPTMSEIDALDAQLREVLGESSPTTTQDPFDPNAFNRGSPN